MAVDDARGEVLARAVDHLGIHGDQIAGTHQQPVAHHDGVHRNVVDVTVSQAVRDFGGARHEGFEGAGCALHRIRFQRFAARLHQHDDDAREVLPQDKRGDDGEGRHDIGGEPAPQHAAHGLPHERHAAGEQRDEVDEIRPRDQPSRETDGGNDDHRPAAERPGEAQNGSNPRCGHLASSVGW